MLKYVIPEIPPSNNRYAGRLNCWEYRSEKQRWKLLVRQAVGRKIPPEPLSRAAVTLIYHFKDKRRRDPDNYSGKMILDGLTAAGIIADDSFFCIDLQLRAVYDKGGYTEIIVEERELMRKWQRGELRRINLLEGSVSSGKTWISLVLWAFWVASMPQEKLYLMCAKSLTTLKRNCLIPLEELVGAGNFAFSVPAKEGYLFGRRILLEGANDARSESKIRGLSLQGAYCDELTQFPEDFFTMLLSRLRLPAAKLIATTNPDNPRHWLKTKYIDRADELDFLDERFLIADNTTLDPDYVKNVTAEYTGVFYERFILGKWTAAEGVIYREFADNPERFILDEPPSDIIFGSMGLDFGGNGSAHAAVLVGFTRGLRSIVILDEYYRKEVISPETLTDDVCGFMARSKAECNTADIYCDSAETTLISGIKSAAAQRRIPVNVHNARKGAVLDRIRFFSMMMAQGRFFILRHCKHTIEALSEAVWDSKHPERDTRLDDGSTNIDSLDALEYAAEPYMEEMIEIWTSTK